MYNVNIALLCASVATALPSLAGPNPNDPRFTQWQAPGPNDVRSPCPGLNTLANHGFIHRDGRNMTIPHLTDGLAAGMNMGADFTLAIGGAGILASPFPLGGSFDLDQLDMHNFPIEHDASSSRQDAYFGNDYSFNQTIWNMVLNYYKGMTKTTIPVASMAKYNRFLDSQKRNPTFTYGPREFIFSYGETALYIQSMSDPYSGSARIDYIRMMFEQEKLPYELGWRPSTVPITLESLGQMVFELDAANPQARPEGLVVLKDTLKDVYEGYNPVTGILANATNPQGL